MMSLKILILSLCVVAVLANEQKVTYTDKYDNIDLEEIKQNRRLLLAYANCVLDKGKCSPEGKELKENLKDAIETGCEKCTKAQQDGSSNIIEHLIQHELDIWHALTAKFDSNGKWRKVYEERAREKGIVIPK